MTESDQPRRIPIPTEWYGGGGRQTAVFDQHPEHGRRFLGHDPNEGCNHYVGDGHRAWCPDCGEWCEPLDPCARCERAIRNAFGSREPSSTDDAPMYLSPTTTACPRCGAPSKDCPTEDGRRGSDFQCTACEHTFTIDVSPVLSETVTLPRVTVEEAIRLLVESDWGDNVECADSLRAALAGETP